MTKKFFCDILFIGGEGESLGNRWGERSSLGVFCRVNGPPPFHSFPEFSGNFFLKKDLTKIFIFDILNIRG
nr:MAG TPA: hypothetical protein [Caudoviricetes sp.]